MTTVMLRIMLVSVALWWVSGCAEHLPGRPALAESMAKTEAAFATVKVQGDVAFWVGQGAMLAGRSPVLSLVDDVQFGDHEGLKRYDFYLWMLRNRPLPRISDTDVSRGKDGYQRGFLANPRDTTSAERVQLAYKLMTDAIDCSPTGTLVMRGMAPDYGYVSTHQLLGLMIAAERGCVSATELPTLAAPYISRIYTEILDWQGQLEDVQVERAALLAMIGRFDLVPVKMVNELVESQYDDGLWAFGGLEKATLNTAAHNTALAYVVVAAAYHHSKPALN